MDWSKGFSATYYATIVDRSTWRDIERFEITGGTVTRSESSLIEAATIDTTYSFNNEQWIRVYMDTRQNGAAAHVAIFTGLAVPPSTQINGNLKEYSMECYSVLKPAEDILLQRGFYIPSGVNGGDMITALLTDVPAPVIINDSTPKIKNVIIAEDGETPLSMVYRILKSINRRLRIDGNGAIHICKKASTAEVMYSAIKNDAIEPRLTINHDWFGKPNVFRAVDGDVVAVARDEREDSFLSIQNRGREVWAEETSVNLSDDESLAEYAERRLMEEQSKAYDVSYSRRYHPGLTIGDYVELRYPYQGLDSEFKITSQNITLGHGAKTDETVDYYVANTSGLTTTVTKPTAYEDTSFAVDEIVDAVLVDDEDAYIVTDDVYRILIAQQRRTLKWQTK